MAFGLQRLTLSLLTSICLTVTACSGKQSGYETVAVALFDVSGSTNEKTVKEQYLKEFEKVLSFVMVGGVIVADVIDDNPLAHSSYPVNEAISPYDPLKENKLDWERRKRRLRDDVLGSVKVVLEERRSKQPGTKILEAVQVAERAFSTYAGKLKVLVVFSDMIEQSDRYDFSSLSLTPERIQQIITEERSRKRLPSFAGVEICVTGAGAARTGGLPSDRLQAIRDFWLEYFTATGGNLPKARYGASLLKCP